MHAYTHVLHIHICAQSAANVLQMCTLMWKEHLYNAYSCTCTGAQITCSKLHAGPTAKKCTYIYTHTHVHTHSYAQEYTCTPMTLLQHAKQLLLRLKNCTQTCIHIHIHMYLHACVYPYIYTCRYIHICMFILTHTYTHIHIRIQHIHMHTRKHALNDSAAAAARGAHADAGSSVSFVQRNQPHLAPPMLGLHCTCFLRHQYPSTAHPLFPTYTRTVYRQRQARFYCSTLINTTEYTTLKEVSCSFTMAPCVVVERLEGKYGCIGAP